MIPGNFSDYLDQLQQAYQRLREQGKDLYRCGDVFETKLLAFPDNPRRTRRSDQSVEPTNDDYELLTCLFSDSEIEKIRQGDLKIFPFREIRAGETIRVDTIEKLLQGTAAVIESSSLDID